MSMVDSTELAKTPPQITWKCSHKGAHPGQTFVASSEQELQGHILSDGKHTSSNVAACAVCGKPNISANHGKAGKKPVCQECREELKA